MKTKHLFFVGALTLLASCSDDSYIGNNDPESGAENGAAIVFNSGTNGTTRAPQVGADAAALLGNRFVVGGFKTADGSSYSTVFDNYGVAWQTNTAGTTASNTSDWEYVNATKSPVTSISTAQTVKYWDYSTTSYDFIAYSTGAATEVSGTPAAGQVQVVAINHTNKNTLAYSLNGSINDLKGCYIADLVTVNKADYGKEVELTFRSLSSKIRMAIYETVPGYSVKDVKFYTQDVNSTNLGTDPRTNAATTSTAALIGSFANAGTYQVKFQDAVAHVNVTSATNNNYATFGTFPATNIGTSSTACTYAPGDLANNYSQVLPNEAGGVLELAVDYTLISDDGSGEEIKVYGAKAYVPATYSKWLPNFAYTYIFKISDNTNGWTSTTSSDPTGLYPITFDAVVLSSEENTQSTITTVASPSITTYQKGHDITKDEYSATDGDIYVQVMVDGTLKNDLGTQGKLYTVTTTSTAISEASVLDALNIVETGTTGRNGIMLTAASSETTTTIPGEDGNDITVNANEAAKFTPTAPTSPATVQYYAYVYDTGEYTGEYYATQPAGFPTGYYTDAQCTTEATGTFVAGRFYQKSSTIYTAVNTSEQPTDWSTDGVWYKDPDGISTAYGSTWAAGYYYKKYTVNHKVYGVKVIKVVE